MSCPKEARKRSKTIAFWVTPGQAEEIDKMVKTSGLSKQDYLLRRALEQQVIVVPNSRVIMNLREMTKQISRRLDEIINASQIDDYFMGELRWLAGLMAAFAQYGEEEFDAVERIINLTRD